ncbi:50S ribosomal protein L4 [Candidatus Woesearchaeota archaeon]|nr:50S ribosomal protein L4 [Candidatus Woesearchaeota archaeon]
MKTVVKSVQGEKKKDIDLPIQFNEKIRPDLIKRAVLAAQSHSRQPYGAMPDAGKRASVDISKRRRDYKTSYGYGISRTPRKVLSNRGTRFNWVGAFAPQTVGGRRAHPPKAEKKWYKKINKKERRKAIRVALSASVIKDLVQERGHIVDDYPLVVETKIEETGKTSELKNILNKLGIKKELSRTNTRKVRSGKGKRRGRKYIKKTGPLIVVSKECDILNAARNIPGVEAEIVHKLNVQLLAPGTRPGRLTIYTEDAIQRIKDERLFTDKPLKMSIKKQEKVIQKKEIREKLDKVEKKGESTTKASKKLTKFKKTTKKSTKAKK